MMPSDAATMAGRRALEASGVDPARIGLLVNTSVSRDFVEPSTASLVHANLKLPTTCGSFDLSNACLGFMDAIEFTGHLIERGANQTMRLTGLVGCRDPAGSDGPYRLVGDHRRQRRLGAPGTRSRADRARPPPR